jgi:ligand-binding sensor domain-containing protein/signal transduction histidine kinase
MVAPRIAWLAAPSRLQKVQVAVLFAGCALAVRTDLTAERLALRTYGVADGLPQEAVKRIVRDSRGFFWFCTYDGLSRFDGTRFVNYGVRDGLPHPSINDLLESHTGDYWIATNGGGVARFDPSTRIEPQSRDQAVRPSGPVLFAPPVPRRLFTSYSVGETPATSRVNVLHEDRSGRIWAGTDDGLFAIDEARGEMAFRQVVLPFARPLQIWALLDDRAGRLWIGTSEGLARRLPDGRTEIVRVDSGKTAPVWTLAEDAEAQLWVGLSTGLRVVRAAGAARTVSASHTWNAPRGRTGLTGLMRPPASELPVAARHAAAADGAIQGRISVLQRSDDGRMWIGTFAGDVFAADRNGIRRELHLDDAITSFAEDRQGNLWVSTARGRAGAGKLARHGFTRYDETDGLTKGAIAVILETNAGELCVLRQGRLHRFDGHRFIEVKPRFDRPVIIRSVLQDGHGAIWLPTDRGLYRFAATPALAALTDARPSARYAVADGLRTDDITLAFEDSRGDIWIGTKTPTTLAVMRRESNTLEVYADDRGLPAVATPLAVAEDLSGNIWVGFREGGLVRYRRGRFEHFAEDQGIPRSEVLALFVDHAGRLWIADGAAGLLRVDDPHAATPSFTRYTTAQGLASDMVRCVIEDTWGRLYIGTVRGIDRLDAASGRTHHYSTADGLAGDELLRAFRDRHGVLWFGSWGGLSRFEPELEQESAAPAVFISGVRTGGRRYPIAEVGEHSLAGLTLQPDEAQIAIEFFGLDVADGDRLRFEYRLDGADTEWNAPTTLRNVNYARLASGAYRFRVRALTPSGATSVEPASVSFRILRPVWLRWWFITSASALLVGFAGLLYRHRVAYLLSIERVRTRIATDLHDDIGASLSQIAILSELVRGETETRQESANTLSRIATISRELVESMGDIVWAINPKRDRVGDLLQRMRYFASDTLTGKDIAFSFPSPALGRELALGADVRREVLLIFKEAINNVVHHAGCGRVAIDVRIDRDALVLRVADDGKGIPTVKAREPGHGLLSMRERATRLRGSLGVDSSPDGGTTLVLRVPLRRAPHTYLST